LAADLTGRLGEDLAATFFLGLAADLTGRLGKDLAATFFLGLAADLTGRLGEDLAATFFLGLAADLATTFFLAVDFCLGFLWDILGFPPMRRLQQQGKAKPEFEKTRCYQFINN